ncbi:MAG: acetolactate decarboxylase [Actinomycetales bacterium]|nr:acetolactate decarboxylase [Actinomycetales bacterium]
MTGPSLRPRPGTAIQQFSFVDALVAGLYEGAFRAAEVSAAGDLGLGCGDALDGELVLLDGVLRVCRAGGVVSEVAPDELVPFAEVARFEPSHSETVARMTEKQFEAHVEALVPSANLFYALRLDGAFEWIQVREAVKQSAPFRPLAEAARDQHEDTVGAGRATMVGFVGPDVFQGLSVADFHLHVLDEARAFGGHVLDFEIAEATLQIQAFSAFTVRLPEVASYLQAELDDMDADAAIREVEGS